MKIIAASLLGLSCIAGPAAAAAPPTRAEMSTLPPDTVLHRLSALLGDSLIPDMSNRGQVALTYWTKPQTSWSGRCTSRRMTLVYQMNHAPGTVAPQGDTGTLSDFSARPVYSARPFADCATFHPEKHDPVFTADSEWTAKYGPSILAQVFAPSFAATRTCSFMDGMPCTEDLMTSAEKAQIVDIEDCGYDSRSPDARCLLFTLSGRKIGPGSLVQVYFDTRQLPGDVQVFAPVHTTLHLMTDARPW